MVVTRKWEGRLAAFVQDSNNTGIFATPRDFTLYYTIQYNTIQYNTIQYNTIQYNTMQCNTIQYNTIQYNTIQYNTIQVPLIHSKTVHSRPGPQLEKWSSGSFLDTKTQGNTSLCSSICATFSIRLTFTLCNHPSLNWCFKVNIYWYILSLARGVQLLATK